jgi:hypothetical protein
MSEDNKANISYVYQRWMEIKAHLQAYSKRPTAIAANIKLYLNTIPVAGTKLTGINKKN